MTSVRWGWYLQATENRWLSAMAAIKMARNAFAFTPCRKLASRR